MNEHGGCDKVTYATEREAKRAARDFALGKPGHKRQVRKQFSPYRCSECACWHLTSRKRQIRKPL